MPITSSRIREVLEKAALTVRPKTHEERDDDIPANVESILASTEKLLAVSRGVTDADERDSLEFRQVMRPADLFAERVHLDADKLLRTTMRRVAKQRSLKAIGPSHFDRYATGMIIGHELSAPLEEINPLQLVEQARRITQMGPGGLPSEESITPEAQALHPSTFGFLSSVEGPECHSGDTLVFTRRGWVLWPEVVGSDLLACLVGGVLEFHKPERLVAERYTGAMLGVNSQDFDFLVTPNHAMWSRRNGNKRATYDFISVQEQFGKNWKYATAHGAYAGHGGAAFFELPEIVKGSNAQKKFLPVPMVLWARFLGYWLAAGCCDPCNRTVKISKDIAHKPEVHAKIAGVLNGMRLSAWSYSAKTGDFSLPGVQLLHYLQQFGKAGTKFIPDFFFDETAEVRHALLEVLLETDSRINATHTVYCSVSKRLAEDAQRLMISLGYPTNLREEPDKRGFASVWCACLLKTRERISRANATYDYWVRQPYDGIVYCATVPGGLLFTRRGCGVGLWSGNSSRIGIDTRIAWGVRYGSDGKLYQKFKDRKAGQDRWVSYPEIAGRTIGIPR